MTVYPCILNEPPSSLPEDGGAGDVINGEGGSASALLAPGIALDSSGDAISGDSDDDDWDPFTDTEIGDMVLYMLSGPDVTAINRRRTHARNHMANHREAATGVQVHVGSSVSVGDVLPLVITKVMSQAWINGKVLLDGTDDLWVTTVVYGQEPGQWTYG